MVAARRKRRGSGFLVHLLGLVGAACLLVSGVGLWRTLSRAGDGVERPRAAAAALRPADFYPLEVGRYWVYRRRDPRTGDVVEIERRIVRRERRGGRELFFFGDGTVAFREDGKIFEMGPEGGVNVVPLAASAPYVYSSRGFSIEKRVGARDTVLLADGRRYERCLQIITEFRRQRGAEVHSYASYYAPGIGLVGRETWPAAADSPTEVLRDYGPRSM